MSVAAALGWIVAGGQAASAAPFLVEMVAGLPRARVSPAGDESVPETVVLIPAHDEASGIGGTLRVLAQGLPPSIRLLVVADNCSDDTAAIARAEGVEVIERHDASLRGKGYALAFGRDHLRARPPAVVIVVDADCAADPDSLARLATATARADRPVQSLNLIRPRPDAPAIVQISSFAFLVKNLVRQRGLARLGAPLPLCGTGMALPWPLFRDAALASGNIVEDLALSVELALAGRPAGFEEGATIWSDPAAQGATMSQRARWEGGFLQTARTHGLPLIGLGLCRLRPSLAWLGLHVATPPLALLMLLHVATFALTLLLGLLDAGWGPSILSGLVLGAVGAVVLAAWALYGRRWLSPVTLAKLPLYMAWKVPLYLRLLTGRGPRGWVRTDRGG